MTWERSYMLYRAAVPKELRIRPETVKFLILQWHESIGISVLNALGCQKKLVDATISPRLHYRALPETLRTLASHCLYRQYSRRGAS